MPDCSRLLPRHIISRRIRRSTTTPLFRWVAPPGGRSLMTATGSRLSLMHKRSIYDILYNMLYNMFYNHTWSSLCCTTAASFSWCVWNQNVDGMHGSWLKAECSASWHNWPQPARRNGTLGGSEDLGYELILNEAAEGNSSKI